MVNGRRKNSRGLRAELSPDIRGWTELQDGLRAHLKLQPDSPGCPPQAHLESSVQSMHVVSS